MHSTHTVIGVTLTNLSTLAQHAARIVLPAQETCRVLPAQETCRVLPAQETCRVLPAQETCRVLPAQETCRVLPAQETCRVKHQGKEPADAKGRAYLPPAGLFCFSPSLSRPPTPSQS